MNLPFLRPTTQSRALRPSAARRLSLAAVVAAGALAGAADAATTFTVSLVPSDLAVRPGEDLVVTVRVDIAQDPADPKSFLGAQVVLNYDEAVLEPAPGVDFVQAVTGGIYAGLSVEAPDASTGGFSFFVYDPSFTGGKGSSDIATVQRRNPLSPERRICSRANHPRGRAIGDTSPPRITARIAVGLVRGFARGSVTSSL